MNLQKVASCCGAKLAHHELQSIVVGIVATTCVIASIIMLLGAGARVEPDWRLLLEQHTDQGVAGQSRRATHHVPGALQRHVLGGLRVWQER